MFCNLNYNFKMMKNFSVLVWKDDNKYYVAKNLDLDIVSQWTTIEEALLNLKEATELFLEDNKDIKLKKEHSYFLTNLSLSNG